MMRRKELLEKLQGFIKDEGDPKSSSHSAVASVIERNSYHRSRMRRNVWDEDAHQPKGSRI